MLATQTPDRKYTLANYTPAPVVRRAGAVSAAEILFESLVQTQTPS